MDSLKRIDAAELRLDGLEDRVTSLGGDVSGLTEGWGKLFVDVTAINTRQARMEKKIDLILLHLGVPRPP